MQTSGFWWILLAGAIYGVLHSFAASLWLKGQAARLFGEMGRKHYRLGFVVFALITTLAYFSLVLLLPDARLYVIPAPWVYLTGILQLAAALCMLLSLWSTGIMGFLGLEGLFHPEKAADRLPLVTGGFYKYTRHPIYFFSFVVLVLMPFMTWNLLSFEIGVILYTLIGSLFEERKLVLEYGQDYIDYRNKTPWIIPIKLK